MLSDSSTNENRFSMNMYAPKMNSTQSEIHIRMFDVSGNGRLCLNCYAAVVVVFVVIVFILVFWPLHMCSFCV